MEVEEEMAGLGLGGDSPGDTEAFEPVEEEVD